MLHINIFSFEYITLEKYKHQKQERTSLNDHVYERRTFQELSDVEIHEHTYRTFQNAQLQPKSIIYRSSKLQVFKINTSIDHQEILPN
jgi:hypothetical protein